MKTGVLGRVVALSLVLSVLGWPVVSRLAGQDVKLLNDKAKSPPAAPQQKKERPISVDVNMVLVNVSVADPLNRLVMGLEKENFRIFEGGKEQKILHFGMEDVPVSLGMVFDCSGSMSGKSQNSYNAALQFVKIANPQDEFMLVGFSSQPQLVSTFTTDVDTIAQRLMNVQTKGTTALFDALYLTINQMRQAKHQRKAILIISDGGDNHSRYNLREVKELVKESDVQIYSIGIFGSYGTPEEREGPWLMNNLASLTGGRSFTVGMANAPDVAAKIGLELRNEYIIGYRPENDVADGKWRKIEVKLVPPRGLPPLRVYAKQGYYAPGR